MKRRNLLCMIAVAFLLCWGGVVSCSNDSSDSPGGSEGTTSDRIDNGDGTFTLKIQEHGDGFVSSTGDVKKEFAGFTGSGYLDGLIDGGNVVYTVYAAENINDAKIAIHYLCTEPTRVRAALVEVNGTVINEKSPLAMTTDVKIKKDECNASHWKDTEYLTDVSLKKGENAIIITGAPAGLHTAAGGTPITVGDGGYLNYIDYLIVTGKGIDYGTDKTPYYALSYRTENKTAGEVTSETAVGSVKGGTEVTLSAKANAEWKFECWSDGATENPYKFNIKKATTLSAHFVPEGYKNKIPSGLVGYATITSDEGAAYTITGGAGAVAANKVTIASHAELVAKKDLLASHEPKIITISGTISTAGNANPLLSEKYTVGSNTTIYGDTANQGRLQNIELSVEGENVIIRNMMLGEVISWDKPVKSGADDALSLNGATHVWIDHCEFQSHLEPQDLNGNKITSGDYFSNDADWKKDFYDGLLDIKNGSTWITISNCYFHDHWKACLCASGDGKADKNLRTGATDVDMRVTFYGNYWKNINARQPLFRWGKFHVYDSYFDAGTQSSDASCINVRAGAEAYVEGNTFIGIKDDSYTVGFYYAEGGSTGKWTTTNNVGKKDESTSSYRPPYKYNSTKATTAPVPGTNVGVGVLTVADLK